MSYAITITNNYLVGFDRDLQQIEGVLDFINKRYKVTPDFGDYEVQPNGRHLLHYHGQYSKNIFVPLGIQKKHGVNVFIKPTFNENWKGYSLKLTASDIIWRYQQRHQDMFQE